MQVDMKSRVMYIPKVRHLDSYELWFAERDM